MTDAEQAKHLPTPSLDWGSVLSSPITKTVATWDGTEGAVYQEFGIAFESGSTLNLTFPERCFRYDATTVPISFEDDLKPAKVPYESILGHTLRGLIYFDAGYALHHLAVLDDGHYLTSYHAMNYTEFAYGAFREWRTGATSRCYWRPLDLTSHRFFNSWTHERVDPFALYR